MQLQAMLNMNSADKNLARPRMMTEQFLGACICQKINKLTDKEQQHVRKMSHFLMLGPEEQSQYVFFYFNILSSNLKMETVGNMFSQGKMSVNKKWDITDKENKCDGFSHFNHRLFIGVLASTPLQLLHLHSYLHLEALFKLQTSHHPLCAIISSTLFFCTCHSQFFINRASGFIIFSHPVRF